MGVNNIDLMDEILPAGNISGRQSHPWRKCPWGKHLVKRHIRHIPPSKKHPNGTSVICHEHCANNPSKKEELSHVEIQYISETYFSDLIGPPASGVLKFDNVDSDAYDKEIRGWTQYWNDVFKPTIPLDANLVKALIATESGFRLDPKGNKIARGLMQVRNTTRQYLADPKGELRNYLIRVTPAELLNPTTNICAGVRWLFRKKETATWKLKREATWKETLEDYKSYLDNIIEGKEYNHKPIDKLYEYYERLQAG